MLSSGNGGSIGGAAAGGGGDVTRTSRSVRFVVDEDASGEHKDSGDATHSVHADVSVVTTDGDGVGGVPEDGWTTAMKLSSDAAAAAPPSTDAAKKLRRVVLLCAHRIQRAALARLRLVTHGEWCAQQASRAGFTAASMRYEEKSKELESKVRVVCALRIVWPWLCVCVVLMFPVSVVSCLVSCLRRGRLSSPRSTRSASTSAWCRRRRGWPSASSARRCCTAATRSSFSSPCARRSLSASHF